MPRGRRDEIHRLRRTRAHPFRVNGTRAESIRERWDEPLHAGDDLVPRIRVGDIAERQPHDPQVPLRVEGDVARLQLVAEISRLGRDPIRLAGCRPDACDPNGSDPADGGNRRALGTLRLIYDNGGWLRRALRFHGSHLGPDANVEASPSVDAD